MRFLDLDLDFFLNRNAYLAGGRLGREYQPWSETRVRRFLEDRCCLSLSDPLPGRTILTHDGVLDLWRMLIESGRLETPFEVVHVDAHPDLWTASGLTLAAGALHIDPERELATLSSKNIHAGNYLTFAVARGWISSLVWVPLGRRLKAPPAWDADARSEAGQLKAERLESSQASVAAGDEKSVPFYVVSVQDFKMGVSFDYMALSRSPNFTPPQSDGLISVVEGYMRQI